MRPPRLRCTLFPLIYPPHLLLLPATFGLHLFWQTYPYFRALYVISVRRTKGLPTASFRFHLTMDTLAVWLYTSSLPRHARDFHPLERAHGARTKNGMVLFDHAVSYSKKKILFPANPFISWTRTRRFPLPPLFLHPWQELQLLHRLPHLRRHKPPSLWLLHSPLSQ